MNAEYIQLSYGQVALATLLVLTNAGLSLLLRLRLERSLLIASLRMVVQLLLIGSVLQWVFATKHWLPVSSLILVMTCTAGTAAVRRTDRRFPGVYLFSLLCVAVSSWLVIAYALTVVLGGLNPFHEPQYAIPLLGMVLGNTLNGITLGLDRFGEELVQRRDQVEMLLALGATRWEAARPSVQLAIRTGMIPMINSMMVTGIVSLPGMMTGQILSGVPPLEAVKYQIVIMFLIASATALGTVAVVLLSYRRLFNSQHQFLHSLISQRAN